jgi:Cysteine dioxygenase type I
MTNSVRVALEGMIDETEFCDAMKRFADTFGEYRSRLPAIPYAYSRTRLLVMPRYELVAIHWSPGSTSPIHDHGESRCWVLMMEGSLAVENFQRESDPETNPVVLRETGRIVLRSGDVDYRFGPYELHRVSNSQSESAYSLQLYAGPITSYSVVNPQSRQGRVVDAVCDLDITAD